MVFVANRHNSLAPCFDEFQTPIGNDAVAVNYPTLLTRLCGFLEGVVRSELLTANQNLRFW